MVFKNDRDFFQWQLGSDDSGFATLICSADSGTNDLQVSVANVIDLHLAPPSKDFAPGADFTMTFTNTDLANTMVTIAGVEVLPVVAGEAELCARERRRLLVRTNLQRRASGTRGRQPEDSSSRGQPVRIGRRFFGR